MNSSIELAGHLEGQPTKRVSFAKRLLLLLLTGLLAAIVALFLIPRQQYAAWLSSKCTAWAKEQGLLLALKDPQFIWTGVTFQSVSIFIPRAFTSLELGRTTIRIAPLSLIFATLDLHATSAAYDGNLTAKYRRSMLMGEAEGSLALVSLNLSRFPQLQAFGVTAGMASATLDQLRLASSGNFTSGDWSMELSELSKSEDTFFTLPRSAGGGFIAIPAFSSLSLTTRGKIQDFLIAVESLQSSSSLGSAQFTGTVNSRGSASISAKGVVKLSAQSQQKYGPFLPLVSRERISASTPEFQLELQGPLTNPRTTFSALDSSP